MAKIISAKDYGPRKVIRVCLNPEDPESVHPDGASHTGATPAGTPPGLGPWEWCHDCRYNWVVREFVWNGEELYTTSTAGSRRLKTNAELLDEIKSAIHPTPTPVNILRLANLTLGA